MIFTERIKRGATAPYIELLESERELYRGAGWCLVAVENGRIIDIKDIDEDLTADEMSDCFNDRRVCLGGKNVDLSRIGKILLEWAGEREVYLGMMSCFQFCMPERFGADRLARVAQRIVEQITQ